MWNVASKHEIRKLRLQHEEPVDYAGFSPDGTRIVTAAEDTLARLWDAASGHPVATLKGGTVAASVEIGLRRSPAI